jgi:hypothetical protein
LTFVNFCFFTDFDDTKQKRAGGGSVGLFPFPRFEQELAASQLLELLLFSLAESAEAIQT